MTLTTPSGTVLDGQSGGITVESNFNNIERWQVSNPEPGNWQVQVNSSAGTSVSMVLDEYLLQMRLLGAANGNRPQQEEYYEWQRVPIEPFMYFPQNGNEIGVEIKPSYPLDVEAYITSPQGGQRTLSLNEDMSRAQGKQFVGDFVPLERGEYVVDISATVNPDDPNSPAAGFSPLDTRSRASKARIAVSPVVVTATTSQQGDWIETVAEDVCVIIQDSVNRRRVDNMDSLNVEAVLTQSGSEIDRIPLTYQADLSEQCTFTGGVLPPGAGTYTLTVEAFAPDGNGAMQEVFSTLPAAPLNKTVTVQPIDRIHLEVVEPTLEPGESQATSNVIEDRPFWQRQPLTFSVIAKDQNDQPVDLATLAGVSPDQAVDLQVRSANGNDTPALNFARASNYLYRLETFELGRGGYILNAAGAPLDPEACQCNYVVDANGNLASTVSVGIERTFPLIVLGQFGLGFLALALVIGAVWGIYKFYVQRTENPMSGDLVITVEHPDTNIMGGEHETTLSLGGRFNRQTFSGSDLNLPGDLPIKSIFVTNYGKETWKNEGRVNVRIKYKDGKGDTTHRLTPGQVPEQIYRTDDDVIYFIGKDPGF